MESPWFEETKNFLYKNYNKIHILIYFSFLEVLGI